MKKYIILTMLAGSIAMAHHMERYHHLDHNYYHEPHHVDYDNRYYSHNNDCSDVENCQDEVGDYEHHSDYHHSEYHYY